MNFYPISDGNISDAITPVVSLIRNNNVVSRFIRKRCLQSFPQKYGKKQQYVYTIPFGSYISSSDFNEFINDYLADPSVKKYVSYLGIIDQRKIYDNLTYPMSDQDKFLNSTDILNFTNHTFLIENIHEKVPFLSLISPLRYPSFELGAMTIMFYLKLKKNNHSNNSFWYLLNMSEHIITLFRGSFDVNMMMLGSFNEIPIKTELIDFNKEIYYKRELFSNGTYIDNYNSFYRLLLFYILESEKLHNSHYINYSDDNRKVITKDIITYFAPEICYYYFQIQEKQIFSLIPLLEEYILNTPILRDRFEKETANYFKINSIIILILSLSLKSVVTENQKEICQKISSQLALTLKSL